MIMKRLIKKWSVLLLSFSLFLPGLVSVSTVQAAETGMVTIPVNEKDGSVTPTSHDGPQIKKIRVLQEANYLEIYWDRYVDEIESIDIDNFVLKNGSTILQLEAKGTSWTNTLYFDKENKEIAATSANSMARLDPDLHMSSISFYGSIDPSKEITLEIIGDTIKDKNGKTAQNATYSNVPYLSFYTQSVKSNTGIIVKADDTVNYNSLLEAAKQIDVMLSKTETGISKNMEKYGCSLAVYSPRQNVYLIPEHRYGFSKDMYDVEGYGGSLYNNCVSSIAEQNIIRTRNKSDQYENTMYRDENILIHEFGHCVRSVGMDLLDDPTLKEEFIAVYNHAKKNNLWPNTYAISNSDEFFATMCTIWFNVMSEAPNWNDGTRCPVNTKTELAQYDPHTYEFFSKILPDTTLPSPWNSDVPDKYKDSSYDPNWKPEPEPAENKKMLKTALSKADMIDISIYGDGAEAMLKAAVEEAQKIYNNDQATQLEIDLAVAKLDRVSKTLPPIDNNIALNAKPTTSFVSDWESLDAVNDGIIPSNSYNPSISRYGTWGNESYSETITYTWDMPVSIDKSSIYFWYDGTKDNYTSGGIKKPKEYIYEYLDTNGNWQAVANPSGYTSDMDKYNSTTFDKISTTALRISLTKQAGDGNGIGVIEWTVSGYFSAADKTELNIAIQNAKALEKINYTAESYNNFEKVLSLAEKVNVDELAGASEVELVIVALSEEQKKLVELPTVDSKPELPYIDVTINDWFYDAVYYNYIAKTMTGLNETQFGPSNALSRGQFALILYRMENVPTFETKITFHDIIGNEWYGPAVLWAAENGIVTGYLDGNFGPTEVITREQIAVMMYRYADYKKQDTSNKADFSSYTDASSVSSFASKAMQWAVGYGILKGKENETILDPLGNTTRSEAAIIIQRFMEK